jgi:hypothetical protein
MFECGDDCVFNEEAAAFCTFQKNRQSRFDIFSAKL